VPERGSGSVPAMAPSFVVARNPDEASTLPYLLWVPVDEGLALKAKAAWPAGRRVFCQQAEWAPEAEIVEQVAVRSARRRGAAVDLVLDRGRNARSQFVFTTLKGGRPAVFWQTPKAAKAARPGARVPRARALGADDLVIVRDTRERYGYRFADQATAVTRQTLRAGDYAVVDRDGAVIAAVERKTIENLAACLSDGSLSFQLAELAEVSHAAVVVEGRYQALLDHAHTQRGWLADVLARIQVRFPRVPIVFCDTRRFAEEYTFRFLGAARAEHIEPGG
jgi:hypothetical protein